MEDETFKPYYVGKITCASLNAQKKLVFVIDSNGFCMKSKFKDSMPTGSLNSIRMQIDHPYEHAAGGIGAPPGDR